jgi:hypothetical protein
LEDVNANININVNTQNALANLRQLQAGLSRFNQALTSGNAAAAEAQKSLTANLMQSINATGKFIASQETVHSSTTAFTNALEKNQLSMKQYFRYTAAAATSNTNVFKNMFAQEREILTRASKDRVKMLQTQYTQLTQAQDGFVKVLKVVPKSLQTVNGEFSSYATRMQMTAQRQQFLNQLLKQGSTNLLNFGKNTQWAGRQLMVGLTIPLTMFGAAASQAFKDMEMAAVKFQRVYGDMFTSNTDVNKALKDIQTIAKEFTKYGVAAKDTVTMAAEAAAAGFSGSGLSAQVIQASRLAVLGQLDQQQALQTTISLQNAFGISAQDLAKNINFLNAVENQTVLSLEDMTIAIPKAAPIIKQLGGDVKDLTFFLTAMKEGGINASEGANALKSGLASMINPTKAASDMLAGFGINIKGIVDANAGNLKGTVLGIARALDTLDPLNRARAIEQMFGKFQFARISTLFQNITKDGSQASRALDLAGASMEELAILSERELGKVENATTVKFQKSIEQLKLSLIPVGKAFLQAATPIVEFVSKLLEKFNNLGDGTKKAITIVTAVVAGIGPIALMTFGLVANGVANLIKFFAMLRGGVAKLNGSNEVLGAGFDYLTNQETENLALSNALHTSHKNLIEAFDVEVGSVNLLATAYGNAASQAARLTQISPGLFNASPGAAGAASGLPKKFANGGIVPGSGNTDSVPAMLTPGEMILTKDFVKNNPELVAALQNNSVKKYHDAPEETSQGMAQSLRSTFIDAGGGSDAFKSRMNTLLEGATSQTKTGVARVIRFAKESGHEITATQTDEIEYWRKEMLKAVKEAGDELVNQVDLSRDQIKDRLKTMSPIEGSQAEEYRNTFDLVDSHGSQNLSSTFGHLTAGVKMSGTDARKRMNPESKQSTEVLANDMAAEYLNNLPKSDPRKPETPIVPGYNVVSGLGIDGMSQKTNTELKEGTKNTQEFLNELDNVEPVKAWDTLMKQNGLTMEKNGAEITVLHTKLKALVAELAKTKAVISDSDVTGLISTLNNDPDVSPRIKNATKRSENKITAARLSGVSSKDAKNMEDVIRSGEVKVPGLEDPKKFKIAKSGSAQGGESSSNRVEGIGFYDAKEEVRLAAEAKTLRPPRIKAAEKDKANAEAEGAKIGEAALKGVRKGATTESPSREGKKVGKDIADGIIIGMQKSQPAVESQSTKLGNSAIPKIKRTAADTQSKVSKMDLTNKGFYDDLNTPELMNERQILKSQDRHRRKMGASRTVDASYSERSLASGSGSSSSISISSQTKIEAAKKAANIAESNAAKLIKFVAEAKSKRAEEQKRNIKPNLSDEEIKQAEDNANKAALEAARLKKQVADLESKQYSDKLNNPDEKQIQKSIDRQSRKLEKEKAIKAKSQSSTLPGKTDKIDQANLAKYKDLLNDPKERQAQKAIDRNRKKVQQDLLRQEKLQLQAQEDLAKNVKAQADAAGTKASQSSRLSIGDAQNLADDFAMDKNGQIIMDPQTGDPMNKKTYGKYKRGMRKEKVGKYSGKVAGALGTATMVAGMVGAPPAVTGALGAASTLAGFAPMIAGLSGPQGLGVAVVAAAAGLYLFNKHLNSMAAAAAQFAKDLSATRDGLKAIGQVSGKVGSSEIMDKRREKSQYNKYTDQVKISDTFGKGFLGSDPGKKEKELFQKNIKEFGKDKAIADLGLKLATAVADGVLDSDQANSIAANLAIALKDQSIEMQVVGQIRSLIGPDGEDLKKNPMKTRIGIIAKAQSRTDKLEKDISKKSGFRESSRKEVAALAALNINNLELQTMLSDQVQIEYETAKKKLETELLSTTNAQKRFDIEEKISKLNSENLKNSKFMNDQIFGQIIKNQMSFDKIYSSIAIGKQAMREDAYFDASRSQVQSTYKGTNQEDAAKKFLNKTERLSADTIQGKYNEKTNQYVKTGLGTNQAAQRFQAKMEMLVGSKILTPGQATSYMDLFTGKLNEMDFLLNAGIKTQGTAKTKELFDMFAGFSGKGRKVAQSIITDMILTKKDPKQYDAIMETLNSMKALDGNTIDLEILVKTTGLQGIDLIKKEQEAIQKIREGAEKGKKTSLVDKDNNIDPQIAAIDANMAAVTESLKGNQERFSEFKRLSVADQAQYLQALAAQIAYESNLTDAQRQEDIRLIAIQQATNEALSLGFSSSSKEYYKILEAKIKELKLLSGTDLAVVKLNPAFAAGIDSNLPKNLIDSSTPNVDTSLDDIMKRLRNVRNSMILATTSMKELNAALGKVGSKAILDKFDGLSQKLIKLGKNTQFVDFITGMAEDELKKFGTRATKSGSRKVEKRDKFGNIIYKNGKEQLVTEKYKAGDFLFNREGRQTEQGFNKAIAGEFNDAQLRSVTNLKNEEIVKRKLYALGYSQSQIEGVLADQAYTQLVATGKITKEELKKNAALLAQNETLTKQQELRARIAGMFKESKDNAKAAEYIKRIPELVKWLKESGVAFTEIQNVINDPTALATLVDGMDSYATATKEVKDQLDGVIENLQKIPERKIIELVMTESPLQKVQAGYDAAMTMFDAYKLIDENTIQSAQGNTYAQLQRMIENANNEQKIIQDQIAIAQLQIDQMQKDIQEKFTKPIEDYNRSISNAQRILETNAIFGDRTIKSFQDQSNILGHDLDVMNHAAEAINKKYDDQAEALSKVAQVNQDIIDQQRQQLGLADALSQGDIAGAAKAIQDMRFSNAANAAKTSQDALSAARDAELNGLTGATSGLTKDQIAEKQYQLAQQIYALENNPQRLAIQQQIIDAQDKIYNLEQGKLAAEKEIADYQVKNIDPLTKQADIISASLLNYQLQSDQLFAQISLNDQNRTISIGTRDAWVELLAAATAADETLSTTMAVALAAAKDISGDIETSWASIKASYDAIQSKSITITQYIKTVTGSEPPPVVQPDPSAQVPYDPLTGLKVTQADLAATNYDPLSSYSQMLLGPKTAPDVLSSYSQMLLGPKTVPVPYDPLSSYSQMLLGPQTSTPSTSNFTPQGLLNKINSMPNSIAFGFSSGGMVTPKYFASGGYSIGTDKIPAMLTPGEFVMNKYAVQNHGIEKMRSMNKGSYDGSAVYNYNLSVNVDGSNSEPEEIARVVMRQIRQLDSQRIRTQVI